MWSFKNASRLISNVSAASAFVLIRPALLKSLHTLANSLSPLGAIHTTFYFDLLLPQSSKVSQHSFTGMSFFGRKTKVPDSDLKEENWHQEIRPVILKMRKVKGKMGLIIDITTIGDPTKNAMNKAHWGVQVGSNLWELSADKKGKEIEINRLSGKDIWFSDVAEKTIGFTNMSDHEIQSRGGLYSWPVANYFVGY